MARTQFFAKFCFVTSISIAFKPNLMPIMAQPKTTLKKMLNNMTGLRLASGKLLDSEADTILIVSRMTQMHPSRDPYHFLTKEMVHDKLLEMMETCHTVRQLMLKSSRMENLLWEYVQMYTSWAQSVPLRIIRKLALELAQGAWNNRENPQRNSNGDPLPWCKLAIASLQFARDIQVYEKDAKIWKQDENCRVDLTELRAPAMRANGKPNIGRNWQLVTIPVFPVKNLGKGYGLRIGRTSAWEETEEEPDWMKALERV